MAEPGLAAAGPAATEPSPLFITGTVDSKTSTRTSGRLKRQPFPDYLLRPYRRLTEFAAFEEDWDSYGASPISYRAIDAARQLLLRLPRLLGEFGDAGPYAVAPLASGGIQFEWRVPRGSLELEIGPNGDRGYLLTSESDSGQTYEEKENVSQADALKLVARILNS